MANEVTKIETQPAAAANAGMMAAPMLGGNAAAQVAMTREMAETLAAAQMAMIRPRNVNAARDRILNACTRPKLAETACYTYNRGGTDVTGPSIRLAEMLAQNWGNMTFGVRELEQRNGESTCEAFAWDMETNARQTKVFQVPHIRHTKYGDKPLTDPRDIYELVANNGARRLRACILGVIPGDIVEEAVEACDKTMTTKFEVTPARLKSVLERFEEYGVTREQIEERIQCHYEAMKPAQMANLGKIYNSLKDGMSKPSDWFAPVAQTAEEAKTADPVAIEQKPDAAAAFGVTKTAKAAKAKAEKPAAEPAAQNETAPAAPAANGKPVTIDDLI